MRDDVILHIAVQDKFIPPFIDFLEAHFDDFSKRHVFFVEGLPTAHPIRPRKNVLFASDYGRWNKYRVLLRLMYRADKVVLHGLWSHRVIQLLALQPWLLRKCYWVIWGGDLYCHELRERDSAQRRREKWRRFVIRRVGHLVTFFDGEYKLAKKWYRATGAHHRSFTYPSNVFKHNESRREKGETINIQVGNSATHTNQHFSALERLSRFKNENVRIFIPLSYGDHEYASRVVAYGVSIFGEKLVPLFDFLPYREYLEYLETIDIAVFNHNRQQGVGNIVSLLGMGKTVYMSPEVTSWTALRNMGLQVFDVEKLDIARLSPSQVEENRRIVSECFCEANLIIQLRALFGDGAAAEG